jgi:hypothetical protein
MEFSAHQFKDEKNFLSPPQVKIFQVLARLSKEASNYLVIIELSSRDILISDQLPKHEWTQVHVTYQLCIFACPVPKKSISKKLRIIIDKKGAGL